MSLSKYHIAVSVIALFAAGTAQAQSAFELDEITAFANLTPTQTNRSGATVRIVTEEELEAEGPTRLADFLAKRAGISISTSGGEGNQTTLRIRGLASQYIAVRIDGIDVTDPSGTQVGFEFSRLTTADISRIEIVKGSQSALYGTSAVGGVINITTKRAETVGTTVGVGMETGSFGTFRGNVNVTTRGERAELSFTASTVRTDGFSAADEDNGNTEADAHEANRLSFAGSVDVSDTLRLGFSGFVQDSKTEFDNFQSVPPFLPADGAFLTEVEFADTYGLRLFAEITGGAVDHTFALSTFENDRFLNYGSGQTDLNGDRQRLEYLGTTRLAGNSTLSFGAEYSDETLVGNDTFGGPVAGNREIVAGFAELPLSAVGCHRYLGLAQARRLLRLRQLRSARVALAHRPDADTVLRAVVSNGFRAPSLYELYEPSFGDATLQPEESLNLELGAERQLAGGGRVAATLFYTEIQDLIDFDFGAGGYIQTDGVTKTNGIELAGSMPLGEAAEVFANYTYTNARGADGSRLVRVPENDLTIGLEGDITDRLSGVVSAQFASNIVDGQPLADYAVANATVSYQLTDKAETYLRVVNIFDEAYQTTRGYGTSDRAFYVGIRARF